MVHSYILNQNSLPTEWMHSVTSVSLSGVRQQEMINNEGKATEKTSVCISHFLSTLKFCSVLPHITSFNLTKIRWLRQDGNYFYIRWRNSWWLSDILEIFWVVSARIMARFKFPMCHIPNSNMVFLKLYLPCDNSDTIKTKCREKHIKCLWSKIWDCNESYIDSLFNHANDQLPEGHFSFHL